MTLEHDSSELKPEESARTFLGGRLKQPSLSEWYDVSEPAGSQDIESRILMELFRHRRLLADDPCDGIPCPECFAQHTPQLRYFTERRQPIHFVLPAFPAKSPNQRKVLGELPDTAERIALAFLNDLCIRVGRIYSQGAILTLCSDGQVFADIVGVKDQDVVAYKHSIQALIDQLPGRHLAIWSLGDVFPCLSAKAMRVRLIEKHGVTIESIRKSVKSSPQALHQFNGTCRFIFEDLLTLKLGRSRTSLRNEAKATAYLTLQRTTAWSNLVRHHYPRAVRLSIHPQPAHHSKLGVHLLPTNDNWMTPWHGVAVDTGNGVFTLMKRFQAEALGARIVRHDGRAMHFRLGAQLKLTR